MDPFFFLFALLLSEGQRDLPTRSASGLERGCLTILRHMSCVCIENVGMQVPLLMSCGWKNATLHASHVADSRGLPHHSAERGTYLLG
jgi:hypothetical protein